jgi:hypothetical protein
MKFSTAFKPVLVVEVKCFGMSVAGELTAHKLREALL